MATTFPTPPVDGSGGYAEILATDAVDTHLIRIHLAPFSASPVGAPYNYAYDSSHGSETGVNDTLQNFMNIIRIGYDASWGLAVHNLVRNNAGTLTPIFPVPQAAASGNSGKAAVQTYDIARATVNTFTGHTTATTGRTRMVLRLPSWGVHKDQLNSNTETTGELPGLPQVVQANSGGDQWEKVVAYLTGDDSANGLRAHDGFIPQGVFKVTINENKRLARRYGFT